MVGSGETEKEAIRFRFPSIVVDFHKGKVNSDAGSLLPKPTDERVGILGLIESRLADIRAQVHSNHTRFQMVRPRVHQIAARYERCYDANFL